MARAVAAASSAAGEPHAAARAGCKPSRNACDQWCAVRRVV
jgi:hypothetical protein